METEVLARLQCPKCGNDADLVLQNPCIHVHRWQITDGIALPGDELDEGEAGELDEVYPYRIFCGGCGHIQNATVIEDTEGVMTVSYVG